jgi:MFS family permease
MPTRPSTARLLVLAVLVVTTGTQAVFLLGASFFQIGPELGLGTVGLGALTAAFFLTASITSAPLGRWVQRVGWQRAMRLNLRASAGLLTSIAVGARSAWSLAALLIVSAGVYGMSNPAANQALADHTDPDRQATLFGAKHAGIPGSTMLAGLAVPVIVVQFGWRWAFVAAAVLALCVSLLVPTGDLSHLPAPKSRRGRQAPQPMSTRYLLALAVGSAFATWAAIGLGTFLVSASLDVGLSESAAGTLQFAGSACSILARIVAGAVTDRVHGRGFYGMAVMAGMGAIVFFLLPGSAGIWFMVLVVAAFATGWGWPGLMTYTVVNANRGSAAASSAVTQSGVFVGAGLGPLLLASVIERWSFGGGWVVVGVGLVAATVIVTVAGRRSARASIGVAV